MKKMMFLALALSVMAMGSVSAADNEHAPRGFSFGVNGAHGHVMVSVGGCDHGPRFCPDGDRRPGRRDYGCCDSRHDKRHKRDKRGDRHNAPRGRHYGNRPGFGAPGRPVPPPPPGSAVPPPPPRR